MKTISQEMKNHLQGEVTSLCRCWILKTALGEELGFTDHDENIILKGVLCEKNAGVEASQIEESLGLNVNTNDVEGALQSNHITAEDINAGKYDNARVSTYIVNWQALDQFILDQVSLMGEITQEDGYFRMEFRSLSSQLEQTKGNHFISECQADLGDGRCKVFLDRPEYKVQGQIAEVLSPLVLRVTALDTFESGWFRGGHLTWLSGENVGRRIEITEQINSNRNNVLHLWQPMPYAIQPQDQFSLHVGCDKSFETCKRKFSNTLNFRGFPHIPGNDFVLSYAANSDVFDGEPIKS